MQQADANKLSTAHSLLLTGLKANLVKATIYRRISKEKQGKECRKTVAKCNVASVAVSQKQNVEREKSEQEEKQEERNRSAASRAGRAKLACGDASAALCKERGNAVDAEEDDT